MVESKEIETKAETEMIHYNLTEIYKNLYEESPGLYRTINMDGIIVACNNSYAKNLEYSKKEIIGKSIFDHTAEKSLSAMNESFETWKNKGKVSDREIYLKRKDGSTFPVLLNATNLYDKNGNLIGSNTVLRDMSKFYTKLKLKDDIIMKQLKELKKLDLQKNEFVSMIAHELKTPLVPIKGYLDLILSEKFGSLNENIRSRLDVIQSSTSMLIRMTTDLLDVQKMELGKLKFNKEVHNLHEIVNESISNILPDLQKRSIAIIPDMQGNITCLCDRMRILQVLANLIHNAMKFSEDGEKIHIKLNKSDSYAKIVIKDNGIGIESKKLDNVFSKFFQIDSSFTREHSGTGLGLAICKGIIENHNGRIWAESEGRGNGAEIHILLPLE